jgi:hypothetical protein
MDYHDQFWGAINASAELWKMGEQQEALKVLDENVRCR